MKQKIYIGISAVISLLGFGALAFASQITVPSAPGANYMLVSTTTGNYLATTTISAVNFRKGEIVIKHLNGTETYYVATTTTDVGRGTALLTAQSALVSNDAMYLAPATFDVQGAKVDLSKSGTLASTTINGSGKYVTIIKGSKSSDFIIQVASSTVVADLGIVATNSSGFVFPVGNQNAKTQDVLIQNVYISGTTDGIYFKNSCDINATSTIATVTNVDVNTAWDGIFTGCLGTIRVFDSVARAIATSTVNSGLVAEPIMNANGGIVEVYNTTLEARGGTSENNGVLSSGTRTSVYGGSIITSGTNAYDLNRNAGTVTVTANTIYDPTKTNGTITRQDNAPIRYSIGSNGASSTVLVNQNGVANWQATSSLGLGTLTSLTAGTGLTGGTITNSGTIALSVPVSIANGGTNTTSHSTNDVCYFDGTKINCSNANIKFDGTNMMLGNGSGSSGAQFTTNGVASVQAQLGTTLPFYFISNSPTLGFNAYYNGGWAYGQGSGSDYGAAVSVETGTGRFLYYTATSPGAEDTAISAFSYNQIIARDGKTTIGGSASPVDALSTLDVLGNMAIGSYAGVNAAPSNGLIVSGNVGVGTTSPYAKLSVVGQAVASYFTATTTATSTFTGDIVARCFSNTLNGTCIGGSSLSGGSTNALTFWTSPTTISATSSPTVGYIVATTTTATSTFAGAFSIASSTPSPNTWFSVGSTTPSLFVDKISGKVGVNGTTTPSTAFSIGNTANFSVATSTIYSDLVVGTSTTVSLATDYAGSVAIGSSTASSFSSLFSVSKPSSSTLPFFTIASTTGTVNQDIFKIDQYGHIIVNAGKTPAISCSPSGGSISGDDVHGTITTGTLSTSCTVTFSNPYTSTPLFVGLTTSSGSITAGATSISTTGFTVSASAALTGSIYYLLTQ